MSVRHRIASLLPSTTEIAWALGQGDRLVARSHECDYPPGVKALPALTEARLDSSRPGAEIDGRVKTLLREGLSIYRVDADALREAAPSVILTQDQCEVCAASQADVETALADWLGERPEVVSLSPLTLGDVFDSFLQVANALGVPERGRDLNERLTDRITELAERAFRTRERPRVACIEWIDPLMAAGNWMPELLTLAAAESVFGAIGEHSPWLEWEALVAADPDAILVVPCGFDLARTRRELSPLTSRPGFAELRAVREGRFCLADGNAYFNRPGPRLVDSLEILCELLHPEAFLPRSRGTGWEPL